jgi:predicted GTPase
LEEEAPDVVRGKRVLVIDDGPSLMHGGIALGAGYSLVKQLKDVTVADHHPWHIQKVPTPQGFRQ